MTKGKTISLMVWAAIVLMIIGFFVTQVQVLFGAAAIRDENNIPAVFGSSCDTATAAKVDIGHQVATTIQATTSDRAFLSIEQPQNATNTVSVVLNGAVATAGAGIPLAPASTSNIRNSIEMGITTLFPYTGGVSVISSTGSTTVNVITCSY